MNGPTFGHNYVVVFFSIFTGFGTPMVDSPSVGDYNNEHVIVTLILCAIVEPLNKGPAVCRGFEELSLFGE